MRRAFKVYQTADGHWTREPQNPGDTVWHVSMPDIRTFCDAMSNIQDELAATMQDTGVNQTGIPLSAQGFMSQIFDFETGPYNSFENGDGPANKEERAERLAQKGKGSGSKKRPDDKAAVLEQIVATINFIDGIFNNTSKAQQKRLTSLLKQLGGLAGALVSETITPAQATAQLTNLLTTLDQILAL